ncbi:MAG: FAD-binding protein [Clostridiales bacterium]|nr:FAD-binding protein [Clostridiales bacterium]
MKKRFLKVLSVMLAFSLALGISVQATESAEVQDDSTTAYTAGTYQGSAGGRGGDITVEVTLSDSAIEAIEIVEHQETPGISDLPLSRIPEEIIQYQSLDVDTISGATLTSNGIINAVADALNNAGADVSALENVPVEAEEMDTDDLSTQIVIAGGGMAGLTAAAVAAHEGADVILVEKQSYLGGSLMLAGGGMVTVNSEVISAMGADDDLQRVMDYIEMINETSERQPDYEFVEELLSETGATIDYLANEFGLEITYTDRGDYIRSYFGEGSDEVRSLSAILEQEGVTVLLDTEATEIVMEDNQAVGLTVANSSGEYTIWADKVMIATGGASWDQDRLLEANPELETVALNEQANKGNTGDGFTMLEAVGAQMGEGPFIKSAYPDFSVVFRFTWRNNPSVADQLVIDADGLRFANESPYNAMMLNKNMLRHESPAYYAIFDTVSTDADLLALLEEYAENDSPYVVVYGETMEELAEKLSMDAQTLQATFDRYQELCAAGEDTDYGKDASHLIAYSDEGGYYAAYLQAASWGTIGGALTDYSFHVLDENNEPIGNLYAIGECATSTLFGDYYLGGFSLGFYSTAGRIAAQTAVAEIEEA